MAAVLIAGGVASVLIPRHTSDVSGGAPLVATAKITREKATEHPFVTKDVVRAFRSVGVRLRAKRLVRDGRLVRGPPCKPPVASGWACDVFAIAIVNGHEATRSDLVKFAQVTLFAPGGTFRAAAMIYANPRYARDAVLAAHRHPVPSLPPTHYERAGNVVVQYQDRTDAGRIRVALRHL